jgi:hypothetical protein
LLACAAFFWSYFDLFGFDMLQDHAEMFVLCDRRMGHALVFVEGGVGD